MKRKLSLLLPLLLLSAGLPSSADVYSAGPPLLGMGYNPASIVPVSQAIPIYTIGDQLWLESNYNQTVNVEVIPPGSSAYVAAEQLNPNNPALVYTFLSGDPLGTWSVVVGTSSRSFAVQNFALVAPSLLPAPKLRGYTITSNGTLITSYGMDLRSSYLDQGCVVGSDLPNVGVIPFSASVGVGTMSVKLGFGRASFFTSPSRTSTSVSYFDFWLELYYPYSYSSPYNSVQLTTSDVLVGRTTPVTIQVSSVTNTSSSLAALAPLRQGRYELRAYFRDVRGLSLYSDTLLFDGSRWIWFSGCISTVNLSSTFSIRQSLTIPVAQWQAGIFYAAFSEGIEGVGYVPIQLNLTKITLHITPYGGALPSSVAVSAQLNPNVANSTYYQGTFYFALSRIPSQIVISVGYSGAFATGFPLQIFSARNTTSLGIPFGILSVTATSNSMGLPNGKLAINTTLGKGESLAQGTTSAAGTANFYLLGGNYSVKLRTGSFVQTEYVDVTPGRTALVKFTVPYSPDLTLSYALMGVAAFGILLNVFIWRRVVRRG